ncbi:MAG TPA: SURF1 family protein [Microvirga sp.]|nr:SURF1 family protein [Microvirga sp.]
MNDLEWDTTTAPPRSPLVLCLLGLAAALGLAALAALGTWQLERRSWKLELMQRIEERVHRAPVAAPARQDWGSITAADHEYRRVRVTGDFLEGLDTLVQASTRLGPGYWLIAPLRTAEGAVVLVNRGFVSSHWRDPAARRAGEIAGPTTLTGLLRMSEPGGALLRANDPSGDRWYSRDVAAIAAARGLADVAPYFVDADASGDGSTMPVGGLTVIAFRNHHLLYAITWYALALMLAGGTAYTIREEWRARRREPGGPGAPSRFR